MNPFSGFLQPQNNRPLEGLATAQDLLRTVQDNKQMAQRKLENEQQNTRANAYLGLQQGDQAHRFGEAEKKQIEGLLAEYQDAEDQGDPVRLSRAAQMLKRFGMDVSQGQVQQRPDLRALTGERTLPSVSQYTGEQAASAKAPGNLRDFTGQDGSEADLSQEEWEKKLIEGGSANVEQPQEEADIAGHLRSVAPLKALNLNSREQQDAENISRGSDQADPGTTSAGDAQVDFDADAPEVAPATGQAPEPAAPRRLSTQLLPTVVSKGGKQLYESTGPSGRWQPMVSGVFEPFISHENPEVGSAAKRAQAMAGKLIEVDGVAPKDAIKIGMDYLNGEANRIINLERTKLGSRPRGGGGSGGGTGLMGKSQDIAESINVYDDNARTEAAKIQEEDRQYEAIEAAAGSGNPALQRDAINQLLKIRSGTAVTAAEDARISQINGLIAQVQDRLGRWTGGAMTPEMQSTIQQIVALKRQVSQAKIKRIYEHQAKLYRLQNQGKTKDPQVLENRARGIADGGRPTGEPSEEDLY